MASELQKQLAKHKEKHVLSSSLNDGRASLFLSAKEAAGVDISEIFESALSALQSLQQYDSRFGYFMDNIFHRMSMSEQRELKTAEENQVVDENISRLCEILSIYSLNPSVHKILEYLIRRYNVHQLNVDVVLTAMISQHDTKVFARLVQLCKLDNTKTNWNFLVTHVKSGSSVSRSKLVQQCMKDNTLLESICYNARVALKQSKSLLESDNQLTDLAIKGVQHNLSFFTAILIEMSEISSLDDSHLRIIVPLLYEEMILKSNNATCESTFGLRRTGIVIISHICRTTTFSAALMKTLMSCLVDTLVKSISDSNTTATMDILTLIVLFSQQQQEFDFKWAILNKIMVSNSEVSTSSQMLECLRDLQQIHRLDISQFVQSLTSTLVSSMLSLRLTPSSIRNPATSADPVSLVCNLCHDMLKDILQLLGTSSDSGISNSLIEHILVSLFDKLPGIYHKLVTKHMLESTDSLDAVHVLFCKLPVVSATSGLIRFLSQRHPNVFNSTLQRVMQVLSNPVTAALDMNEGELDGEMTAAIAKQKAAKVCIELFLHDAFLDRPFNLPYQVASTGKNGRDFYAENTTLLLSLQHPSSVVRLEAVKKFVELVKRYDGSEDENVTDEADITGLCGVMMGCLVDHDDNVAAMCCSSEVLGRLVGRISPSDLLDAIRESWDYWLSQIAMYPTQASVVLLSLIDSGLSDVNVIAVLTSKDCCTLELPGESWLFMTVARCVSGVAPSTFVSSDTEDTIFQSIDEKFRKRGCAFAAVLGDNVSLLHGFDAFRGLVVKSMDNKKKYNRECVSRSFAACVATNLCTRSESCMSIWLMAVSCCSDYLHSCIQVPSTTTHGAGDVAALLSILAEMHHCIKYEADASTLVYRVDSESNGVKKSAKKSKRKEVAVETVVEPVEVAQLCVVFELQLLMLLHQVPAVMSSTWNYTNAFAAAITTCGTLSFASPLAVTASIPNMSSRSIGLRVLLDLLSCMGESKDTKMSHALSEPDVASLIGLTIHSLFTANHNEENSWELVFAYLMHFVGTNPEKCPVDAIQASDSALFVPLGVAQTSSFLKSLDIYEDLENAPTLKISSNSKAGALVTLAALFDAKMQALCSAEAAESTTLSSSFLTTTCISLVPLLISCCSDVTGIIRNAAITSIRTICQLQCIPVAGNWLLCSLPDIAGTAKTKKNDANLVVTFNDVVKLLGVIDANAAVVLSDRNSVSTLLNQQLQAQSSWKLMHYIMWCMHNYSWDAPDVTISLLDIIAAELTETNDQEMFWYYAEKMLNNCPSDGNENTKFSAMSHALAKKLFNFFPSADGKAVSGIRSKVQNSVIGWVLNCITRSGELTNTFSVLFCHDIIELFAESGVDTFLVDYLTPVEINEFFRRFVGYLTEGSSTTNSLNVGRSVLLSAIKSLKVQNVCVYELLAGSVKVVSEKIANVDESLFTSGLALPLQGLCSMLEAFLDCYNSWEGVNTDDIANGRATIQLLMELVTELNANDNVLRPVSSLANYCKGITIDLSNEIAGKMKVVAPAAVTTSKKSKKTAAGNVLESFAEDLVSSFIVQLLQCISTDVSSTSQLTSSSLRYLHTVMSFPALFPLCKEGISAAIENLGLILSSVTLQQKSNNTSSLNTVKNESISNVVSTFISFARPADDELFYPQVILEPFCRNFDKILSNDRGTYLTMCLDQLGPSCSLSAAVVTILSHAVALFELPGHANTELTSTTASSLILLSRSAQKKASREMKSSTSEELFKLASDVSLTCSGDVQLTSLVVLMKCACQLLGYVANASDKSESRLACCQSMNVDVDAVCHNLFKASICDANERRGQASSLVLVILEYINETLENRLFHKRLYQWTQQSSESLSSLFLMFFEESLQLSAFGSFKDADGTSRIPLSNGAGGNKKSSYLSMASMGEITQTWFLNILKSIQRLLDVPTFITILQDLLEHDDINIRQHAFHILGERLESLTESTSSSSGRKRLSNEERTLYLDLLSHLSGSVQVVLPMIEGLSKGSKKNTDFASINRQMSVTQSALMCMDILVRHFGKETEWFQSICDIMANMGLLSNCISAVILNTSSSTNELFYRELVKLAGSSFLSCSTLCGSMGPKSLAHLSKFMNDMFSCSTAVQKQLFVVSDDSIESEEAESSRQRANVLFLRSIVSSLGSVFADISAFSHPFFVKTIQCTLSLHEVISEGEANENNATVFCLDACALLKDDVERCMNIAATVLDPRKALPMLLQSTPSCLAIGHHAALQYCALLGNLWCQLDRDIVQVFMKDITAMTLLCMDYRRIQMMRQPSLSTLELIESIDEVLCNSVVDMSLKWTEGELKSLVSQLLEWVDIVVGAPEAVDAVEHGKKRSRVDAGESDVMVKATQVISSYSRSVVFYHLLFLLSSKLRSIFTPSMALVWHHACGTLKKGIASCSEVGAMTEQTELLHSKKSKKQSKQDVSKAKKDTSVAASAACSCNKEMLSMSMRILMSIRSTCTHDTAGFVDEARYDMVVDPLSQMLCLTSVHESEDAYVLYQDEYTIPTLTSLVFAVAKDTIWKGVNHKILLMTRNKQKCVRLVAVKTLYKLFTEVGEDYLALLPECLPFFSELLEDDSDEIVQQVSVVIKYVEDLSGESLDSYLLA